MLSRFYVCLLQGASLPGLPGNTNARTDNKHDFISYEKHIAKNIVGEINVDTLFDSEKHQQ